MVYYYNVLSVLKTNVQLLMSCAIIQSKNVIFYYTPLLNLKITLVCYLVILPEENSGFNNVSYCKKLSYYILVHYYNSHLEKTVYKKLN